MPDSPNLLILGGSVRAAALSAVRAGWNPVCIDRFADADLAALSHSVYRVDDSGSADNALLDHGSPDNVVGDFAAVLNRYPGLPALITGSLENSPDLLERLHRQHHGLLANPAAIQRCRDIAAWSRALTVAGLPALQTSSTPLAFNREVFRRPAVLSNNSSQQAENETWIYKPKSSAGGIGVRVWKPTEVAEAQAAGACSDSPLQENDHAGIWQQFVAGRSGSAVVLATSNRQSILAITEQVSGHPAVPDHPFVYAGSTVPACETLSADLQQTLEKQISVLCETTGVIGLLGVDFVVGEVPVHGGARQNESRQVTGIWPIEINPRYTASMELVECWLQQPVLRFHQQAFAATSTALENRLHDEILGLRESADPGRHFAKRIVYAPWTGPAADWHLAVATPQPVCTKLFSRPAPKPIPIELPELADIPVPGTTIHQGSPLCTVFAFGGDKYELQDRLSEAEAAVISRLLQR